MSRILEACKKGSKADLGTIRTCARLNQSLNLVNENGQTGLMFACQNGKTHMVQLLIDIKVDLNKVDKDGNCALAYACIHGYGTTTVTMLARAGANLNIANRKGITPLMYAIRDHRDLIAIKLLEHDPEIEFACNDGFTPLILACNSCTHNQHLVNALLSKKSSELLVNHQDGDGNTALHYAIRDGYNNHIYLELLKSGANPHLKNKNGENVMDIIEKMENTTGSRSPMLLFVDLNNKDVKFSIREKVAPYAYHPRFATHFGLLDDVDV